MGPEVRSGMYGWDGTRGGGREKSKEWLMSTRFVGGGMRTHKTNWGRGNMKEANSRVPETES